jgi:hypothetical protein
MARQNGAKVSHPNLGDRLPMKLNRIPQFIALLLIPAMLSNALAYAARKPLDIATVNEKIAERGVGHEVRVALVGKIEVKGIIVSIGDQSFVLKAKGADQPQSIQYAQVTEVKGGHPGGLSEGAKVGIFIGIGVVLLAAIVVVIVKVEGDVIKHSL